jgi:hypothetical protein
MAKSIPKVTGMDWIVEKFSYEPMTPEEFTAEMVAKQSGANINTVRSKLKRMETNGEIVGRKLLIDGRHFVVYKQAEAG